MQSGSVSAAPDPTEALHIANVSKGAGFPALTLTIPAGECVVLSGPSGVGKSTLLRLIVDLDPGIGSARIGNRIREEIPAYEWRKMVAYVPADSGWWAPRVSDHMSDESRARSLLAPLGLPERLMASSPDDLSSGERQRLALIRAMIRQPRFMLLDEPTASLDPATARLVENEMIRATKNGLGLLVVSHDPDQIARLSDRHYVLSATGVAGPLP